MTRQQRFSKGHPCPICHGYEEAPRGQSARCYGFLSDDGDFAHCVRDDHAGRLSKHPNSDTYAHKLTGNCLCGERHDSRPPEPSSNGRGGRRRIVATYDYTDAQGKLLYQAVRYMPKGFSQRRPDPHMQLVFGKESWLSSLDGVPRVLYRLPAIVKAVQAGQRIFVVEGEEDVKALVALGLEATTNSEGAGKWRDQFSEVLHGADVVVLRDYDVAGHRHRDQVVRSLYGKAARIAAPELPGLTEAPKHGKDIRDWLQAGHTTEELLALVEQTPALTEEDLPEPPADLPECRPVVVTMSEVEAEPIEWLWWPYIACRKLCLLDGDPGIGKTLLMTQLAASLSRGQPLPDQQGQPTLDPGGPQATLLLSSEDGLADTLKPRLEAAGADCSKIHVLTGWLGPEDEEHAFTLQHMAVLEEAIRQYRPRLVVIDPIQAYLGPIDMHRANETRPLLAALTRLAEQYGCAIVCIRHPSKPGQGEGKVIHRGLGSIDFIGAARTALFVEQHPTDRDKALMAQSKSNIGALGRTQVYSKAEGVFRWCGVSRLSAELMAGSGRGPDPQAFLGVVCWLEDHLKPGIPRTAKKILEELDEEGYSPATAKRAKKALGIVSLKSPKGWLWKLPPLPQVSPPLPAPLAPLDPLEPLESLDPLQQHHGDTQNVESDREGVQGGQEAQVVQEGQEAQVVIGEDAHANGHSPLPASRGNPVQEHAPAGTTAEPHAGRNDTDSKTRGKHGEGWTFPRPTR